MAGFRYVTLTAAGHALIERSVDGLLRHEEALLGALTSQQRGELAAHLKVLLASLSPHPRAFYLPNELAIRPGLPSASQPLHRALDLRPEGRGFRPSRAGVPVSQPTAPGRTRSV